MNNDNKQNNMDYYEETVKVDKVYEGNIIDVEYITVKLPNGKIATRDVVRHPGASVIIPLTDDGYLYLVEQYRKPNDVVLLELPAGKLDKGEDPYVCAERELKEETGLEAREIKKVFSFNTTPGFSDEIIHMYIARGLEQKDANPDEDEFLSCRKYSIKELKNMVMCNTITDGKTIIGILIADRVYSNDLQI